MEFTEIEIKELVATSAEINERATREIQESQLVLLGSGFAEVCLF
jgi:hypothetical protein